MVMLGFISPCLDPMTSGSGLWTDWVMMCGGGLCMFFATLGEMVLTYVLWPRDWLFSR